MLRMGVASRAETFTRLRRLLDDYEIQVVHLSTTGRRIPLTEADFSVVREEVDIGFVFPPRLMEGTVADVLLDVPWVNDRSAVLTSRNKAAVLATLHRAGLPVPKTDLLSSPVDEEALRQTFDRFEPPVVIKPNSATQGRGIVKVEDVNSFLGVADYLGLLHEYPPTADKTFLVQEFISSVRDYRAMVLEGTYVGAVERRSNHDGWTHNVHRGATATGVRLPTDLRDLAERAAEAVAIPFVGVDILVNDDRAVITETNARPTVDAVPKYEAEFVDRLVDTIRSRASN